MEKSKYNLGDTVYVITKWGRKEYLIIDIDYDIETNMYIYFSADKYFFGEGYIDGLVNE
jgi:hypothetical protein